MYISSRERSLLEVLLSTKQKYWTVQELAEKLDVSTRTIHRDLNQLPSLLQKYHLELLKQVGVGTLIKGEDVNKQALQKALVTFATEYSPEERKWVLLVMLLNAKEPQKLAVLARECQVTPVTISQDLTHIEKWLSTFDLYLIRRRSWGISIEGEEEKKRRAMSTLITEQYSEENLFQLLFHHEENVFYQDWKINSIFQLLHPSLIQKVAHILLSTLRNLPYQLADNAYIMLIVHIVLAIQRIREKQFLDKMHSSPNQDTPESKMITILSHKLEEMFHIKIPETEKDYFFSLLKGMKISELPEGDFDPLKQKYYLQAMKLLEVVKSRLHEKAIIDQELVQDLSTHLERAIYRLQHDRRIVNPLLSDLKVKYHRLFLVVKDAVKEVFPQYQIPDDEIGYIVMHAGSLIEQKNIYRPLRALIVCSSGIGTSKLLINRLAKEFPEITEFKRCSFQELQQQKKAESDIVISTIPLHTKEFDYLKVSPFLTNKDVDNIQSYLQQITVKPQPQSIEISRQDEDIKLPFIRDWSNMIMTLIEGCTLHSVSAPSLEQAVEEICRKLITQSIQSSDILSEQLLERHQMGGLGIPGTQLALLHTRSTQVEKASLTIHDVMFPLQMEGMNGEIMQISRLLVLLAPVHVTKAELEALSWVSSLLVENEENMRIFDKGDLEKIRSLLQTKANEYMVQKLQR